MTPLNTIIEEEKEEAQAKYKEAEDNPSINFSDVLDTLLTSAIQRAYEAGQSEERAKIREEVVNKLQRLKQSDDMQLAFDHAFDAGVQDSIAIVNETLSTPQETRNEKADQIPTLQERTLERTRLDTQDGREAPREDCEGDTKNFRSN